MNITASLKDTFRRVFHIRRGEEVRSFFMFCYIFLIIASLMIIKPVSQSLFLAELGPLNLPYAYIFVAISAAFVSWLYSRKLRKISLNRLIVRTLQIAILSLLVFWLFLRSQYLEGWVLYVFYIWVAIFAVISVSQFWILANVLFNTREAKRLFGFIGSGAIAGGIVGGYTTNILAPVIGSEHLLFLSITFLGLCIPLSARLWAERLRSEPPANDEPYEKQLCEETHPVRLIFASRHLILLASIMGIGVLVAKLVDYQFSAVASTHIVEEDELTAFFGFWLSNLNIASLLIQLFVTRKVVGVFGVGTSLFFLPAGILLGALAALIHPSLVSVVFLKMSDGSLKNSINKAGLELLALPIPTVVKNRTRPFIDVFGDSLATGLGGLLLVVLTTFAGISTQHVGLIIVGLVIIWFGIVVRVKQEYLRTMRHRIVREPDSSEKDPIDFRKASVIGGIIRALEGPDEDQTLEALRMIRDVRNDLFLPSLGMLLGHTSASVRAQSLRIIYFYHNPRFLKTVTPLVKDKDFDVRAEAIAYIFHNAEDRIKMLLHYLDDRSLCVRTAALLCAALESRNNMVYQRSFQVRKRVDDLFKAVTEIQDPHTRVETKKACAKIIGLADIPELHPYLYLLLKDGSKDVVRQAIESTGRTRNRKFIPLLLSFLGDSSYKPSIGHAFAAYGADVIPILVHFMNNPAEPLENRLLIPRLIASVGMQKSVNALMQNLDHAHASIQREVIRALNRLRVKHPELRFEQSQINNHIMEEARIYAKTLAALYTVTRTYQESGSAHRDDKKEWLMQNHRKALINALENRLDNRLERIFRLLGLRYPPDDIYNVYLGVRSQESDVRLNAVEFLDNVLSPDLKKMVIPIVESTIFDALVEKTLEQFHLQPPGEVECLSDLLRSEDHNLMVLVLSLIGTMEDTIYLPHLAGLINHPDPDILERVREILKKMRVL